MVKEKGAQQQQWVWVVCQSAVCAEIMAYLPTFSYANSADSDPSTSISTITLSSSFIQHFVSHHSNSCCRYCSNLYPEAESYHICNWCLSQNAAKKGELQATQKATSPNSSSSSLKTPSDHMKISTRKRVLGGNNHGGLKDASDHIKKQKKSSSAGRKRVTTDHGGSNIGKKTRSEEVPNGGVKVFRNKVRRYKLLDEVPS
ncbi:UNVERIFIED_CONTAM: hypothetical protein Sangu_1884300 [Sesamum angustifolium]|uniref:Uncharacterized protein n=1 Tax=Sesamum angustifolium TaxID=2727405 RepID=A0AAW2LU39_9LAMI